MIFFKEIKEKSMRVLNNLEKRPVVVSAIVSVVVAMIGLGIGAGVVGNIYQNTVNAQSQSYAGATANSTIEQTFVDAVIQQLDIHKHDVVEDIEEVIKKMFQRNRVIFDLSKEDVKYKKFDLRKRTEILFFELDDVPVENTIEIEDFASSFKVFQDISIAKNSNNIVLYERTRTASSNFNNKEVYSVSYLPKPAVKPSKSIQGMRFINIKDDEYEYRFYQNYKW